MAKAKGLYVNPNEFKTFEQLKQAEEIATRSIYNGGLWGMFGMLPDPDPVLRKLGQDVTVYKDLLADEEVFANITRRNMGVKRLDWRIENDNDATDKEIELCELALKFLKSNKTKIKDMISQSLNPIYWGYAVFEVVWKQQDKYWLPYKVQLKPPEWFYFDDDNNLIYKDQSTFNHIPITGPQAEKENPSFKYRFILLQNNPTYENPYGDKALSRCFWPVAFKRGGWRWFVMFTEKYGMPYLVGKQPRGAGEDSADSLLTKLANMIQDAVSVIPDDSSVEILNQGAQTSSTQIYDKFINLCNMAIQKAILTNALSTQSHEKGGYSQSKTGVEIEDELSYDDRHLTEELFDQLFISIIDINLGNGLYPVYRAYEEEEVNKELADTLQTLKNVGVKPTKKMIENRFHFKDDEFEITEANDNSAITGPVPGMPPAQSPAQPGQTEDNIQTEFAENDEIKSGIPDASKISTALLQDAAEEMFEPIIELIKQGKNKRVLKNKLAKMFPKMNDKKMQETLAALIFIAQIKGRLDEQEEHKNN